MIEVKDKSLIIHASTTEKGLYNPSKFDKRKLQHQIWACIKPITILFIASIFISFNLNAFGFNIRIQASDFLLPVFFIILLNQITSNQNPLKEAFKSLEIKAILFIFASLFFIGITGHWLNFGSTNFWGIKKIIGWCICVFYFLIGFSLYEKRQNVIQLFIVVSWFMGLLCLIGASLPCTRYILAPGLATRIQGFMGNPNAYGILCCFALLLQISSNHTLPYKKVIKNTSIAILLINLVSTTSRAAWISFIAVYFFYALKNNKRKKLFTIKLTSTLIFIIMSILFKKNTILENYFPLIYSYFNYLNYSFENIFLHTIHERIYSVLILLPAFSEHPITGIGLGGAMTLHHGQEQYTIHNTALWFLIEMGIIGFAAFTWFVYKLTTALRTSQDVYIKALIFPMLSFAIASLANELFYQRYFWVFAGMIMCDYIKRSQKIEIVA